MINIKVYARGYLCANSYLVYDDSTLEAVIIDPTIPFEFVSKDSFFSDLKVKYILLTHCHFDHLFCYEEWRAKTQAITAISEHDGLGLKQPNINLSSLFTGENKSYTGADVLLKEGDSLPLGDYTVNVLSTPGHTLGSVCFLIEGNLFSGDTLFANGDIGRTDFPTGSEALILQSIDRLLTLDKNISVYPGHGPVTTIETERSYHKKQK